MAWYNDNWTKRKKITIASSQVDSDLIDFPVYVDLSAIAGISNHEGIRVTKADGTTEVAREIVSANQMYFKGDPTAASDTDYYIYYGNTGASDYADTATYGRNNVWIKYEAVWHLEEDPSGTAPQIIDSSGNGYDMESVGGMTTSDLVSATLGNGLDFDGSDDYLRTPANHATYSGTAGEVMWVSAIINNISANGTGSIINFSSYHGFQLIDGSLLLQSQGDNSGVGIAAADVDDGLQHIVHGAYIQGTEYRIYKDGSEVVQKNTTDTEVANDQIYIGELQNVSRIMGGLMDEVRWAKIDHGASWASAENVNQITPATFYTVGTEEEVVTETHSISVDFVSFTTLEQTINLTATQDGNQIDLEWTYS